MNPRLSSAILPQMTSSDSDSTVGRLEKLFLKAYTPAQEQELRQRLNRLLNVQRKENDLNLARRQVEGRDTTEMVRVGDLISAVKQKLENAGGMALAASVLAMSALLFAPAGVLVVGLGNLVEALEKREAS